MKSLADNELLLLVQISWHGTVRKFVMILLMSMTMWMTNGRVMNARERDRYRIGIGMGTVENHGE